jgi:hypothetical protein
MELEKRKADPDLMKFFSNLLELKRFVLDKLEEKSDPVLREIYEKLDSIIKEGKE